MPFTGTDQRELPEEIRQKLQRLERRGPWEMGLAGGLAVSLGGLLLSGLMGRPPLHLDVQLPQPVFFAGLALVFLVLWLAHDRAKKAQVYQVQSLAETLHRHACSELAMRDPVTGAYNRAALREISDRYIERAERSGKSMGMAVLDLDNFRELNSSFGYAAGDRALAEFAQILQRGTRGSDCVARYSGDEFVLLLADTSRAGLEVMIRRVEDQVQKYNSQVSENEIPLRFSAGAAHFEKGTNFEAMLREANLSLTRRKAQRQATSAQTAGTV